MREVYHDQIQTIAQMLHDAALRATRAHKVALEAFAAQDDEKFTQVLELVNNFDALVHDIDEEALRTIARYDLTPNELRELLTAIKLTSEIVRIADYAKSYARKMARFASQIPTPHRHYIRTLHESAIAAMESAAKSIIAKNFEEIEALYRKTLVEENKSDDIFKLFKKEIVVNIYDDSYETAYYLDLLAICRKIERAADRAAEIVKLVLLAKKECLEAAL